jgi:hypothetical protein
MWYPRSLACQCTCSPTSRTGAAVCSSAWSPCRRASIRYPRYPRPPGMGGVKHCGHSHCQTVVWRNSIVRCTEGTQRSDWLENTHNLRYHNWAHTKVQVFQPITDVCFLLYIISRNFCQTTLRMIVVDPSHSQPAPKPLPPTSNLQIVCSSTLKLRP